MGMEPRGGVDAATAGTCLRWRPAQVPTRYSSLHRTPAQRAARLIRDLMDVTRAERGRLLQALDNLLSNAVKFNTEGRGSTFTIRMQKLMSDEGAVAMEQAMTGTA